MARGLSRHLSGFRAAVSSAVLFVPLLIAGIALTALLAGRGGVATLTTVDANVSGAQVLAPLELTASAADKIAAAMTGAGAGFRFEIVQTSTLRAKPGGPKIEVPDPIDRYKTLGLADVYELDGLTESGFVTPAGFWMEMRTGPKKGGTPDFEHSPLQFSALVKNGKTWRDDGDGWYPTDSPPGIGLDPRTVALLPTLLRDASAATDLGTDTIGGSPVRRIGATGAVADIPGIIAVDGERFTKFLEPIDFAFDGAGRLAQIHVVAQNQNMTQFDLVVETTITFLYDTTPGSLPDPVPSYVEPANPDAQN